MSKSEAKERSVFNKICSILIDIFIVPVILIAFMCAILMTSAKAHNKVPSVLGNSIVEVLTPSMAVEGGYFPGDILIIDQNINKDDLKVGDCIAFYAPKASGWVTDNGDSMIIFHRIVRIIYAYETKDGTTSETPKRHFVCHGDNVGGITYIPTQAKIEGKEECGGDYDADGNLKENGGYVVKLLDDTDSAGSNNQVPTGSQTQSTLQYVTDEYVVGKLKSRAGGFISALVKFCCSEVGIILLVIIPSLIMIAMVTSNIVQESRLVKAERESGQVAMAKNISMINNGLDEGEKDNSVKQETKLEQKTEQKQTEDKLSEIQKTIQENSNAKETNATIQNTQKAPAKPVEPKTPAKPNVVKEVPVAPKVATAKAETPKVPTAPKTKPEVQKTIPSKPVAPKAPTVPKAPVKAELPKAPVAPKTAPVKPTTQKAPAKVPPKKG